MKKARVGFCALFLCGYPIHKWHNYFTPRKNTVTQKTRLDWIFDPGSFHHHIPTCFDWDSFNHHFTTISPPFLIPHSSLIRVQVYPQARPVSSMRFPQRSSRSAMAQRGTFGDADGGWRVTVVILSYNMFCHDLFMWWVRIYNLQLQPFFGGVKNSQQVVDINYTEFWVNHSDLTSWPHWNDGIYRGNYPNIALFPLFQVS